MSDGATQSSLHEWARAELVQLPLWGQPGIDCAIRADFRCEYCDRDLLRSHEDYNAWAVDHVVPATAGGSSGLTNLATSCHPCNSIYKRDWDPRSAAGADASRDELIAATRTYVAERRAQNRFTFERVRGIALRLRRDGGAT